MEDAIRRHGTAVYRLAYAYMRSPHDADDVFQDVFLRYAERPRPSGTTNTGAHGCCG